jgi:signal transduction histidine kinase
MQYLITKRLRDHFLSFSFTFIKRKKLSEFIKKKTDESRQQIQLFGIVFFLNYPIYYFIWMYGSQQSYENFWLRMAMSLVCIPLIFEKLWTVNYRKYLPYYWYFATGCCLPFFFAFMTFKNDCAAVWLLNLILALLLTFILIDFISLLALSTIGTIIAYISYVLTSTSQLKFLPGAIDLIGALGTFVAAFFVGGIFAFNRERIETTKLNTLKTMGASIAHELRTPLSAIKFYTEGIQQYMGDLTTVYKLSKEKGLSVPQISKRQFNLLEKSLDEVIGEVNHAKNIIDLMLTNISLSNIHTENFSTCSIQHCIQIMMQRYSCSDEQKKLIQWDDKATDFTFYGDEIYIVHVLFNLLKNALYFIEKKGTGNITIRSEKGHEYNKLYFKDTGSGIAKRDVKHIFNKFYTKNTHQGSGIGLAFSKMVMLAHKGDITCRSEEGQYTEFCLSFPVYLV